MKYKFILGTVLLSAHTGFAAINKNHISSLKPSSVVIAVIDTGLDTHHKSLTENIWTNSGETGIDNLGRDKSNNGLDDDDNGFVDDVHGWNFSDNNNDLSDQHGHGTHIGGIILKEFQKRRALGPSAPSARLMILKYYNPKSKDADNVLNSTKAIEYANKMQAQIINYSGGGSQQFQKEFQAIEQSNKQNILFIAAAGNNNSNTDEAKYYPANYPLSNIISVAATDHNGQLVSFSNYGPNSIDLAAPGKLIYSTLPNNSFGFMSGTSQSTAYVTGVAAAYLSQHLNSALPRSFLSDLISHAQFNPSLKGKTKFQLAMIK